MVPRAAFTWVTARLRPVVKIPLITTNRINTPAVAEGCVENREAGTLLLKRLAEGLQKQSCCPLRLSYISLLFFLLLLTFLSFFLSPLHLPLSYSFTYKGYFRLVLQTWCPWLAPFLPTPSL